MKWILYTAKSRDLEPISPAVRVNRSGEVRFCQALLNKLTVPPKSVILRFNLDGGRLTVGVQLCPDDSGTHKVWDNHGNPLHKTFQINGLLASLRKPKPKSGWVPATLSTDGIVHFTFEVPFE